CLLDQPPTRGLRALAILALGGALSGCQWWDEFASKTDTMKLFTFVPCGAEVRAIPAHQTYYAPSYFSPPANPGAWAFVSYQASAEKHESTALYLSFVAYVGLQHYTAIPTATPPSWDKDPKCGALVVLPWSEHIKRPFFIAAEPPRLARWAQYQVDRTIRF